MKRLALVACMLAGCTHHGSDALAELAVRGALLAGATAVKYSADCPTDCPTGRPCNPATGFCERVPCNNRCLGDEQCVRDARGERCEHVSLAADGGTVAAPAPP